jgi:hypothetical protein
MKRLSQTILSAFAAAVLILPAAAAAQGNNTPPAKNADKAKIATDRNAETPKPPSDQDIENARSQGLVWVNQTSRVYHRGGEFYGKTKRGKFMTENDAKKAGFHEAKEPKTSAKSAGRKGDQSGIDSSIATHSSTPAKP